jgi:hypoxanthine phosphoribosyltransferase
MVKNYKLELLIEEKEIKNKVKSLAQQIKLDYKESNNLVLIGLLRGSVIFISDLIREIGFENSTIDFIAVSSYGNKMSSSKNIKIIKDIEEDIEGKDVIIIEDIIDTGYTLNHIKQLLTDRKPKSLKICTLLDKPSKREVNIHIDYTGFIIEDYFIVGYGIDFSQKYRCLPYIAKVIL